MKIVTDDRVIHIGDCTEIGITTDCDMHQRYTVNNVLVKYKKNKEADYETVYITETTFPFPLEDEHMPKFDEFNKMVKSMKHELGNAVIDNRAVDLRTAMHPAKPIVFG